MCAQAATAGAAREEAPLPLEGALATLRIKIGETDYPGDFHAGADRQVWIATVKDGQVTKQAMGPAVLGLQWPVRATTGKLFALNKDNALVRLDGHEWKEMPGPSLQRLLGVVGTTAYGLAMVGKEQRFVAVSTETGRCVKAPLALDAASEKKARAAFSASSSDSALSIDGTFLSVNRSTRGGSGFDVFLKPASGGSLVNVSDGGDKKSGHVSIAPNGQVLYLQTSPY